MSTSMTTGTDAVEAVAVRRNVWLSGVVAGLAALIGVSYLLRDSSLLSTAVGVGLLLLAAMHAAALTSTRTPVLVADDHGIRLRIGMTWRGLPWGSVRQVVVEHADSVLREGRLVVVPRDPAASLDHLGAPERLHLRWNRLWYGAALSVPLGMTTSTNSSDVAADLTGLAAGRCDVVHLRGRQLAQLDEVASPPRPASDAVVMSELPPPPEDELDEPDAVPDPVSPVRPLNLPARAEVRLDVPAIAGQPADPEAGAGAGSDVGSGAVPAQRRPEEAGHDVGQGVEPDVAAVAPDLVHVEAWEEVPVEVETDDLAVHAPVEPVIGPRIAHARDMLDMSIEELSQRTRIRPHVLEAIEQDDFGPCGGDFYARGHLTAISRVLGLNLEPLMKDYDERYAHGPINARRVFEAELATGLSGGMRATLGGPRWSLLVGAVLCLTMVWGLARLVSGDPEQHLAAPPAASETAGLAANHEPITSPLMKTTPMTVKAAFAAAHVVVRDRTGRILWSGDLGMGKQRRVVGLAPFKVESDNAGAVEVTVKGEARGTLGTAGQPGSKRFR